MEDAIAKLLYIPINRRRFVDNCVSSNSRRGGWFTQFFVFTQVYAIKQAQ